jgi:hypothetical protein
MNNCVHQWIYIGSKRQDVWRCIFCDEYKINDATQKREWHSLTDEERFSCLDKMTFKESLLAIEAKLKEKNS